MSIMEDRHDMEAAELRDEIARLEIALTTSGNVAQQLSVENERLRAALEIALIWMTGDSSDRLEYNDIQTIKVALGEQAKG